MNKNRAVIMPPDKPTRTTRFVCIADTHNYTPKLPPGNVLIHAGDLTNQGTYSELSRAVKWLQGLDYEAKIVIAGNHDITLDPDFYATHGPGFHNQKLESHAECLALLKNASPSLIYLDHEATTVRLTSPTGPRTQFTVFGSPRAPACGRWAFCYPPVDCAASLDASPVSTAADAAASASTVASSSPWDDMPPAADIVVTHGPPRGHGDSDSRGVPVGSAADTNPPCPRQGCEALRRALWRVRPRLVVCGHVHDGRGVSRVTWDLDRRYGEMDAGDAVRWEDPGAGTSRKMSLVDLTGRKRGGGGTPLDNDGGGHWLCAEEEAVGEEEGERWRSEGQAPGWPGRRETCVVNAAITKSSFPHVGGRQFHKPIVVDIDLAVVE